MPSRARSGGRRLRPGCPQRPSAAARPACRRRRRCRAQRSTCRRGSRSDRRATSRRRCGPPRSPPSSRRSRHRRRPLRRRCSSVQEYAPMSRAAMAEVARLYYVRELTQQQIAQRLGMSRFKVLRLLEQARSEGVIRFEIDEPVPVLDDLSRELEDRFALELAVVVERDVAEAAALLLPRLLRRDDVLGVAWGETLAAIAE